MDVIQQSVHETKIHDIDELQKRLMQTCFDFDQNIIDDDVLAYWRGLRRDAGQRCQKTGRPGQKGQVATLATAQTLVKPGCSTLQTSI